MIGVNYAIDVWNLHKFRKKFSIFGKIDFCLHYGFSDFYNNKSRNLSLCLKLLHQGPGLFGGLARPVERSIRLKNNFERTLYFFKNPTVTFALFSLSARHRTPRLIAPKLWESHAKFCGRVKFELQRPSDGRPRTPAPARSRALTLSIIRQL